MITLTRYNVALGTIEDYTEHEIVVTGGDKLRAELEGKRAGLGDMSTVPMHVTILWCWASMLRTGVIDCGWQDFKERLVDFDVIDDEEPVDPTQPATVTDSA